MDTEPKDFAAWFKRLDTDQQRDFALRSEVKLGYIESHLLAPYKIPRDEAMARMAAATNGVFSLGELAAWFYKASLARKERLAQRRSGHAAQ